MRNRIIRTRGHRNRQSGMVTTFTGVLVLVLLTLMMFFAIRVGVFEQRGSANEMRQKLAFHAAESGIHHAKEFLRANSLLIASSTVDLLPNGADGWMADSAERRWFSCGDSDNWDASDMSHPCWGESSDARRGAMYFYNFKKQPADASPSLELPVDTDAVLPGDAETVDVYALLCVLDVITEQVVDTPVQGCVAEGAEPVGVGDGTYFMVTLLARGRADCIGDDCAAEALVSEQVSNFGAASGGRSPSVPLTTRSSFPPSGSAEIVPNPNSGGIGVPISVWMNSNEDCPTGAVIDPGSGSWATCEMHEWYETDALPDDYACPPATFCACDQAESISYTKGVDDVIGIDLVADEDFPCDLFQFYFGVPRENYEVVKGYAKIISDCTTLGPNSFGIYWVTGDVCRINANTQVGSPGAPVMLISAASETRLNGGAKVYGTVFITDVEDADAEILSIGTNTVYGSVIVDGTIGQYQGTFQVVWNDNTSRRAGSNGGLGTVIGGWSDFHPHWSFAE